ncbi:MAG: hypothetical protein RQ826_07650 [Xanthomonadales bacterium]|nr:hypothetical protein [Xanthomonadales bacterium]
MKKILIAALVLLAILAWRDWARREIVHPPGVLVAEVPRQVLLEKAAPMVHGGYRLTPRARFEIHARVLSRADYGRGIEADLSPLDLALGWGVMSDQSVLDRIRVTQSSRWYFTRYELPPPVADAAMVRNSGNMHMVPSSKHVEKALKKIRKGDVVRLEGLLVDVDHDSGFYWRTSLSREDSGAGACEILYVEAIEFLAPEPHTEAGF